MAPSARLSARFAVAVEASRFVNRRGPLVNSSASRTGEPLRSSPLPVNRRLTRPRRAGASARIRPLRRLAGGLPNKGRADWFASWRIERVEQLEKLARPGGECGDRDRDRIRRHGAVHARFGRRHGAGRARRGGARSDGRADQPAAQRHAGDDGQRGRRLRVPEPAAGYLQPQGDDGLVQDRRTGQRRRQRRGPPVARRDHARARRGLRDGDRQHPRRRSAVAQRRTELFGRFGGHREPGRQRPRPPGAGAPGARHRGRDRRRHGHERERRPRQHHELHRRRRQQRRHRQQRRPRLDQPRRGRGVQDPDQRLRGRVRPLVGRAGLARDEERRPRLPRLGLRLPPAGIVQRQQLHQQP